MKKVRIVTLGCRTNQYESQLFSDQLSRMGYTSAQNDDEKVDLCIVNTCTVTDHADSSSRHQIRKLARRHEGARFVVTGCMAESAPEAIHAIDERIEIIPNKEKEKLVAALFPDEENAPELHIRQFEGHTRAFVKVQDGCNSFCTYCIIPYVRGRSVSRPLEEVVKEVCALVENGYQEIVLTGINIGDYEAQGVRLADLVRTVDKIDGVKRLRISSIDPDEVDDDLVDAFRGLMNVFSVEPADKTKAELLQEKMPDRYKEPILDEHAKVAKFMWMQREAQEEERPKEERFPLW